MKEENDIDRLFREKLEGFSENPPDYLWDGIRDKLAEGSRKKHVAWYSWSAVAALIVLAFLAGWYFNETSDKFVPKVAEKEVIKNEGEPLSAGEDVPAENKVKEEVTEGEEKIMEFLADANGIGAEAKSTGSGSVPTTNEEFAPAAMRKTMMLPEAIVPIEATVAVHLTQENEPGLATVGNATRISPFEQEIIRRNATLLAEGDNRKAEWKMGVNVSPGYSSYSAKYGNTYASNMTQDDNGGNADVGGGFSVRYRKAGRWSLESGIYYAQNGQQTGSSPHLFEGRSQYDFVSAPERLYFNTTVKMESSSIAMNSTAGIIEIANLPAGAEIAANLEDGGIYDNSLITQGEFSQVFDLLEIPLYLRYLLFDSNLDVELLGGVNAGVVVGNNAYIDNQYGIQKIGKTRDISTMNLSGTVGVGFSYALGKQFSLAFEPRLNYYLNSLSKNPEVEYKPYRFGLYTGLYYTF